jgi:hypothetical protein
MLIDIPRCPDGLAQFIQISHRFNDQKVNAGRNQGFDLLAKDDARLIRLDSAKRRQAYPQRSNIPGDQYIFVRCQNRPARQLYGSDVDFPHLLFQAMLGKFIAVGAESIGLDNVRAGVDVFAVDFSHQRRVG